LLGFVTSSSLRFAGIATTQRKNSGYQEPTSGFASETNCGGKKGSKRTVRDSKRVKDAKRIKRRERSDADRRRNAEGEINSKRSIVDSEW
jgi:hypothetical protein